MACIKSGILLILVSQFEIFNAKSVFYSYNLTDKSNTFMNCTKIKLKNQ